MEKPPEKLHQRTPVFIGSEEMVRRAEAFLQGDPDRVVAGE
jgi:fructose-1,6-bisphosphatase I